MRLIIKTISVGVRINRALRREFGDLVWVVMGQDYPVRLMFNVEQMPTPEVINRAKEIVGRYLDVEWKDEKASWV